jgi:hypothetical protein
MKVVEILEDVAKIQFSTLELRILANVIHEVVIALNRDFGARIGVSIEEAQQFLYLINQSKTLEVETIELNLSDLEVLLLNNALNTVCHGINLTNFKSTIGTSPEEANLMLDSIHLVINEMDSIQEKKKQLLFSKSNFLNQKEFFLEANRYRVSLYLKHMKFRGGDLGIFIILYLNNDSSEFFLSSNPRPIHTQDLQDFILELENHVESLRTESEELVNPLKVSNELFQVQVENKIINSENEEYVDLSFMISLSQRRLSLLSSFVGIKGAILLDNIQSFTSSVQEFLAQLPEETS